MNIAKKLREVVASNFIEIAKTEDEKPAASAKATPEIDRTVAPSYMEAPPVTPAKPRPEPPPAPASGTKPSVLAPVGAAQAPPPQARTAMPPVAPPTVPTPPVSTPSTLPASAVEKVVIPPVVTPNYSTPEPVASPTVVTVAPPPPVAVTPAPEPEPPAPTPAPVVPARRSLLDQVAPNEPVDLEAIIREGNFPQVSFGAEQAAKVLSALPADLPLQVKRLTVKATLEAVERNRTIEPQEIVADAVLKKGHLSNYRDEFRNKVESLHRETDLEAAEIKAEIDRHLARLQAEMERLNALRTTYDRKLRHIEQATDERIAQMEQVIVFFQSEVAQDLEKQAAARQHEEDEELPAFMRDDSVFRMLGLDNENADTSAGDDEDSEPALKNGSGNRTRTPRRN